MELILKYIKKLIGGDDTSHPFEIGKNYLVRTVTMIYVGKLLKVYKGELVLSKACWIPETLRFSETLSSGEFAECEPYLNDVIIGRGAILDATILEKYNATKK